MKKEKNAAAGPKKNNSKDPKNKGPNKDGGEGNEEPVEEEEGCCDKTAKCIIAVCKFIYLVLQIIINSIKACIAFFWYPIKERCCFCIDRIDKKMNPYKDESYTNV